MFRAINDPEVEYVYDLSDSFCATKEIASKYGPFMEFICKAIFADVRKSLMNSVFDLPSPVIINA